jgi:ATP-dependent DNA ligase
LDDRNRDARAGRERAELVAFDLLMVTGEDIRRWPLIERRGWLAELMRDAPQSMSRLQPGYQVGKSVMQLVLHASSKLHQGLLTTAFWLAPRRLRQARPGRETGQGRSHAR